LTKRLAESAGAMKVADRFKPRAVIGPLIDMTAVEKVGGAHRRCGQEGCEGGGRWQARRILKQRRGGTFFEPTVRIDMTTDMVITKEETFGRWRRSTASRPAPGRRRLSGA
jgi:succinate-semialdehyde dehydrogenase / glutarate-semialdehyde dehydrogenase